MDGQGERPIDAPSPGPAPDASPRDRGPSYGRTLRNRSFLFVWIAQLVSQSGDFIFEVALLWLVLEVTGSAFYVGVMAAGTILPGVVLGPFLGVYVDRWNRRRTLIATNVIEGVIVAGLSLLVLAGRVDVGGLFVVVLGLGSGATLVRTATSAYVPSVVAVDDLPPANSLLQFSGSFNQIVGLSIGGVFVAAFGVALPIEYDAVSFFAAAVLVALVPRSQTGHREPLPATPGRFRTEFAEGLDFIRRHRFMVELIAIGVIVNFFGNGLTALLAPYTRFVLHSGPEVYGVLGAMVAAGSLVGGLAIGAVDTHRTAGRYLFGGGVVLGAAILAVGFATTVPFALAAMLAVGVTLAVVNVPLGVCCRPRCRAGSSAGSARRSGP
ncbi:Major facilitator superfamily MFS-1 [mine drainage metagenome]|uniref:Major facilitator superfamily MFS-1 n=1 Tax=mine drainage metagenome TaxID=410659 RepID=T1BYV0_9ZZZZ